MRTPYDPGDGLITHEPSRALNETSQERFDRAAFARRAIDLVRPVRMTVAICEGATRMRVASGRAWGSPPAEHGPELTRHRLVAQHDDGAHGPHGARWAMLAIPPDASRRAIALAVAELAGAPRAYVLDVLLGEADAPVA